MFCTYSVNGDCLGENLNTYSVLTFDGDGDFVEKTTVDFNPRLWSLLSHRWVNIYTWDGISQCGDGKKHWTYRISLRLPTYEELPPRFRPNWKDIFRRYYHAEDVSIRKVS